MDARTARLCKKEFNDKPIFIGNVHITAIQREVESNAKKKLDLVLYPVYRLSWQEKLDYVIMLKHIMLTLQQKGFKVSSVLTQKDKFIVLMVCW